MNYSTAIHSAPDSHYRVTPAEAVKIMHGRGVITLLLSMAMVARIAAAQAQTIRVDATPGHATNSFNPQRALGAGIDRLRRGEVDKIFSQPVLNEMLSAGWQPVTYRQ